MGRAGLRLREEGWTVVFGDEVRQGRMSGWSPVPGGWERVEDAPLQAIHDRYPSQTWAGSYDRILEEAGDVPIGNPPSFTRLLRDKLATQALLQDWGMPQVEEDPQRFAERLSDWGVAFLKPRYGAFGRGIRRVTRGDPLPAWGEGAVPGVLEPLFLQRAVPAPRGWAGCSARVLAQREPSFGGEGRWILPTLVLRRSPDDPVVNVARGAQVVDARQALAPPSLERLEALALGVARRLAREPGGHLLVEVGVDAVMDPDGHPWLIEVNSRPRGRLEALALADPGRYGDAHVEACARPLRTLARITGPG